MQAVRITIVVFLLQSDEKLVQQIKKKEQEFASVQSKLLCRMTSGRRWVDIGKRGLHTVHIYTSTAVHRKCHASNVYLTSFYI